MVGVHVLAIAGVPFSFLGALALTRRLDSPGRSAIAGLVIYGLGLVAIMIAPAMSGLVGTEIIRKMIASAPANEQWRTLMEYNFMINQAFAKIFVRGFVRCDCALVAYDHEESRFIRGHWHISDCCSGRRLLSP